MKTEWMYFMAGAGLMAAVMSLNMQKDSSLESAPTDCKAVATAASTDIENLGRAKVLKQLTPHERGIYDGYRTHKGIGIMPTLPYLDVYKFCIAVETLKEE